MSSVAQEASSETLGESASLVVFVVVVMVLLGVMLDVHLLMVMLVMGLGEMDADVHTLDGRGEGDEINSLSSTSSLGVTLTAPFRRSPGPGPEQPARQMNTGRRRRDGTM